MGNKEIIFEDAPKHTRIGFYKGILSQFMAESGPLNCHDLHEKFCALIRDESDPWDYSHESSWEGLIYHLKEVDWMEFFDFVEMTGKELIKAGEDPFLEEKYNFESYKLKVNHLFEEDLIGWRLAQNSELIRKIPQSLESRAQSTEETIERSFKPARDHYKKSVKYLYQHPIDPSNSIKEIVSTLESIGRTLHPNCSTLGDVLKKLKRSTDHPRLLIEAYEKIYAYANSTPTIRHGHTDSANITICEAELALHTGIALIRYLIDTSTES